MSIQKSRRPLVFRFVAVLLLSLLVLSGCGTTTPTQPAQPQAPSAAPAQPSQPAQPAAPAPATQAPAATGPQAPAAAQPQRGGVLRISIDRDATVLGYPPEIRALQDYMISATILETLGRYDENGLIQPWLAEGWETDATAKTITIRLKTGIKFHDGTVLDAAAAKWNLDEYRAIRAELRGVESVEVLDPRTVRLQLAEWDNTMLDAVTFFVQMVSPTAVQQNGKEWAKANPVGTGPFKLDSRQRDVSIVFKRFDDYWQPGKPYLDAVEWHIIKDPLTAAAAFKAKETDVYKWIPAQVAPDLRAAGAVVVENTTGLGARMGGIIANSTNPDSPWGNPTVRRALGYAIDREAIVDTVFHGFAVATDQWGHPSAWSRNPDLPKVTYDPEKAKQMLAEAGYPNGFKTTFVVGTPAQEVQWATAVQGYLAKVGIDAQIETVDPGRFTQLTSGGGVWGDGLVVWNSRADADLAMYMPRVFSAGGELYTNGIADIPKVEQLLIDAKAAPDFEGKQRVARALQAAVFDEFALATTVFVQTLPSAKQSYVQDDGFNKTHSSVWSPSTAWLQK